MWICCKHSFPFSSILFPPRHLRCPRFPFSLHFLPSFSYLLQEVAEPLMDLKDALEEINHNKTFKHILATLLAIGNFLNGKQVSC